MFQIETIDENGEWSTEPIGDGQANHFATEAEAAAAITELKALGAEWAEADYRVTKSAD